MIPEHGDADEDPHVEALWTLVGFVRQHDNAYIADETRDVLLRLTTMRSCNTTLAVSNLLALDSIEQAQMLCRPLFEDMAVAHWLLMQEDPGFLIERFFGHQDAIAVREYDYVTRTMGLPYPGRPGLPEALARREELIGEFGRYAQRSWWDARPDGRRIGLAGVVTELEAHPAYAPRMHGGAEPALRHAYALANKWANHQLHHTPDGLPFALTRDGVMQRDRNVLRTTTAQTAYWIFGQIVYLQLGYGTQNAELGATFDELFQVTLRHAFADGMSEEEVRAALAEARERFDASGDSVAE